MIMRTPFDLDIIGKNLGGIPTVKRVMSEPSGSYSGISYSTQQPRLYVWRDSTRPLVVLVGKLWSDVFWLWRMEATRIGALMSALIFFVLGVTLFLANEIDRRAAAEDKLEELATTDALTGLRNRRKFDSAIDAEWRRAARQKKPVALLMIDADHFKTFNDTFGHQACSSASRSAFRIRCGAPAIVPRATVARSLRCCCRVLRPPRPSRWPKPSG